MLVTFYDAPVADVLKPILSNQETFAFSLVILPVDAEIEGIEVTAEVTAAEQPNWPALQSNSDYITSMYADNPSAKILCLAELIATSNGSKSVTMPLSQGTSVSFTRT